MNLCVPTCPLMRAHTRRACVPARADIRTPVGVWASQVVRRDNSQLQRDILKALIKTMVQPITGEELAEHSVASKVELTRQRIAKLVKDFNSEANPCL